MSLCAIGIAAGVLGVVAIVKGLMFRRRMAYFGGYGGGCGPAAFDGGSACGGRGGFARRGWGGRWGGGPGGSFWLRAVFARLDTTPGQEREIRSAIEELQRTARDAKEGLHGARKDLAKAIAGESFDDGAIAEASGRAEATGQRMKDAVTEALRKVHAVLDPRQRERLAELLERGPRWGRSRGDGPYRDAGI